MGESAFNSGELSAKISELCKPFGKFLRHGRTQRMAGHAKQLNALFVQISNFHERHQVLPSPAGKAG